MSAPDIPPTYAPPLMICLAPSAGPILVVGGGGTGLRKIRTLLGGGLNVDLVSPDGLTEIEGLAQDGLIEWKRRPVARRDFEEHSFALLALPRSVTIEVLTLAEGTGCLLNCCGASELGDWSLAAQFCTVCESTSGADGEPFEDGRFVVGVSSGGRSPAGSAELKRRLQSFLEGERR